MGQVYLAEQISLKRKVALKLFKSELSANKTSLERFKREAEAVARATHANIVQIYALGETEGLHFMALEYVEGRNLREFLEKKGPPDVKLGLRIIGQVAAALQQSSELGIVHRDIKPENILLNRKGEVKVTDFGLSRHFKQDSSLTDSRITMGTPLYMSPEQVEGKPVDHRTDIYSFGVTCYHIFAGQPPFRGGTPFEVALQHVTRSPGRSARFAPTCRAERIRRRPQDDDEVPGRSLPDGTRNCPRRRPAARRVRRQWRQPLFGNAVRADVDRHDAERGANGRYGDVRRRSHRLGRSAGWASSMALCGHDRPLFVLRFISRLVAYAASDRRGAVTRQCAGTPSGGAPLAIKELFFPDDREKDLARKVQDHLRSPLERGLGLDLIMELGATQIRERKLDEADAFFKELNRPERRVIPTISHPRRTRPRDGFGVSRSALCVESNLCRNARTSPKKGNATAGRRRQRLRA